MAGTDVADLANNHCRGWIVRRRRRIGHRLTGVAQCQYWDEFLPLFPVRYQIVDEQFANVPADERQLMVCGNAARVWNL